MRLSISHAALSSAAAAVLVGVAPAAAAPWSFGVMSDTQWRTNTPDNPGTVAVGIINQLNAQFIQKDVKFVLQVGDLCDKETNYSGLPSTPRLGISSRAAAAQPLYDAGIGFWPVRGNHESSQTAATEVQTYFPQTRGLSNTFGATNFSSPSANLDGLSYTFDYANARFMLIDQFTPTDGKAADGSTYSQSNNAIASQQSWIDARLSSKPADSHVFVFTHKQLFGQNHTDTLFGKADANPDQQNAFISSLDSANVGYLFTGHDHVHNRSVVTSPDGTSKANQVICASNSYKFYTPSSLSAHGTDTVGFNAGQLSKNREAQVAQELYSIGYYIVTVDGPRATVDFYSADPDPSTPGLVDLDLTSTPNLSFALRETFGYSLNGKQFLVPSGGDLAVVQDSYGTTTMQLSGTNSAVERDYNNRLLFKDINTGWTDKSGDLFSDVLTLWGTEDFGQFGESTAPFTLTLSYVAPAGYSGPVSVMKINDDGSQTSLGGVVNGNGTISVTVFGDGNYAVAVPEPAVSSVLLMAGAVALRRRRS